MPCENRSTKVGWLAIVKCRHQAVVTWQIRIALRDYTLAAVCWSTHLCSTAKAEATVATVASCRVQWALLAC